MSRGTAMEKYIKEAVKNSYFVLAMSAVSIIIGYLLRVFLSRSLSMEDFGLFYAVSAFMGIFILVRYLGLNQATAKFIPEFLSKKEYGKIKTLIVLVLGAQSLTVIAFSALVFIFKDQITISLFKASGADAVLMLMVLSFFPSMFFVLFQTVFQGYQKLREYALVEPVRIFTTFIFSMLLISQGAAGVAMAYLIASVFTTLIFLASFLKLGILGYKIDLSKKFVVDIFKFSTPVLISGIAVVLIGYADTLILTFFRNLEDVALYQVALPTSQLLLVFSSSIAAVSLPLISGLYATKKTEEIGKTIKIMTFSLVLVLVPFVILFISSADAIIGIIFGPSFLGASETLQILSVSMLIYSVFIIFQTTLDAIGKPFLNTKIMFVIAAVNIILNIMLVPLFGILGAAVASFISFTCGMILGFWEVERHVKSSIQYKKLATIFACGIAASAAAYGFNRMFSFHIYTEIVASLFIGMLVYLALIISLRLVTREDVRFVDTLGIKIPGPMRRLTKFLLK